ncbi:MAG: lipid A export permease/ATP-binding protein MsbA [Gammaproteobacteria bacterium]|nr:lipid A export permease/ATP-binding protein MsbA [Gammaproteobacteria bacterium]
MSEDHHAAIKVYKRLLGYAKPYWPLFCVALVAMLVYSLSQAAFSYLMKPLMNGGLVEGNPHVIMIVAGEIAALFVVRGIASFVLNYSMSWIGRQVIRHLRGDLFDKLLRLPTRFFDTSATGILLSKLTYNTEQVAESTTNSVKVIINDSVTVLVLLAWMFYLNWVLSALVLVVVPAIAWLTRYVSRRFRRVSTRIQDSMGEITRTSEEVIAGHRMVKLYSAETAERARFDKANDWNLTQNLKLAFTNCAANPLIQIIAGFGLALVIYVLALNPVGAANTVGDFTSFLVAATLLLPPLRRLTNVNAAIQKGVAAGESIFHLIDLDEERRDAGKPLERVRGRIEFERVGFAYHPRKGEVLKSLSFCIESGEMIALIGRSGSGKSTLASLVPRFYDVTAGQVTLDGEDIRGLRLSDLRRQIAMVTQDVVLFNDTIAGNISYGAAGEVDAEAIREAARAAHILQDIEALPDGFDTLVGERGILLSGGQRQRVAIARALMKNAPILILDEATSALDNESERQVQRALDELMQGRTTLVIAHRLSTIERADRILVLENGRIVEEGSHDELIAHSGVYAGLHRLQIRSTA